MLRAVSARVCLLIAMLWTAATVNFIVPRLTARDPIPSGMMEIASQGGGSLAGIQDMVHAYQDRFGLDQPLWHQYLSYMNGLLHFDLGYSITNYPDAGL